jgi:DNA topoisomerase-6 subunit A
MVAKKENPTEKRLDILGKKIIEEVKGMQNPSIDIPVRSLSNVVFNEKTKSLSLGEKISKRHYFNVAHAKPFMQTLLVAAATKGLVKDDLHTSLRDMFYMLKRTLPDSEENTFDEQTESDAMIVDLLGSGGWAIPSNVEDIKFSKVKADYILVIEKNAAFERLHEDRFWQNQNCILVTTQGQAARGTRRLIQRLSNEHKLPVYVFTDADSYGWYIYSVIKFGSISLAHVSDRLVTPNAHFLGLSLTDIEKFELDKWTIKAEEVDIKRAQEMQKYEWFQTEGWQRELKIMIQKKRKAELESLSGKGLKFITETYLPKKIKAKDFLD